MIGVKDKGGVDSITEFFAAVLLFKNGKSKRDCDITWNYCESLPINRLQVRCNFVDMLVGVA